jgi:hypothetical protein
VGKETVTASCSQAHFDLCCVARRKNQLLAISSWLFLALQADFISE